MFDHVSFSKLMDLFFRQPCWWGVHLCLRGLGLILALEIPSSVDRNGTLADEGSCVGLVHLQR